MTSVLRVALLTEQLLAPVPGGTGRYTAELGAALARTATAGAGVTGWVAAHRDVSAAAVPGLAGPRRFPLPVQALARVWARGLGPAPRGADVVHAPTPLAPPVRAGVPLVVTVHDTVPWTHPETLTPHGARWHREMVGRAAEHAAAIVVPSAPVADDLVRCLPGLDPARVHVLGAGVSRALLAAAAAPPAARLARVRALGLPERYVVTLATLEPRKGLDLLVDALASLPAATRPVLACVGAPGWGGVDLEAHAQAAGLPDGAVRVLGRLPDDDLAAVLTGARALVAPSRAEGFGLPVLEAMALGVPVVASDVPAHLAVAEGVARTVAVGDGRVLAAAIAEVAALADADPERTRMTAAGRERADQYTWDAVAVRAWALYRRLAG